MFSKNLFISFKKIYINISIKGNKCYLKKWNTLLPKIISQTSYFAQINKNC